jgi:hypothetical protein
VGISLRYMGDGNSKSKHTKLKQMQKPKVAFKVCRGHIHWQLWLHERDCDQHLLMLVLQMQQ